MNGNELYPESSRSLDDLWRMRLLLLLSDMVDGMGKVKAAKALRVNYRTLDRAVRSERLTERMSDALGRHLLLGGGSAAAQQRERVETLEEEVRAVAARVDALDERLDNAVEELRQVVKKGFAEAAGETRRLERRLAALETGQEEQAAPETACAESERPPPRPRWRLHRELVTREPEHGEEQVYGEAAPVIVRWRRAREAYSEALKTGTALVKAEAKERVLELEIAIIRDHELTLPPTSFPWSRAERREQVWKRERSLQEAGAARNRALVRRWLRRVLTFNIWRN